MKKPTYNIYYCPTCNKMEYTYHDDAVHRWCKHFDCKLEGISKLGGNDQCDEYSSAKPKKAKFLQHHEYFRKYHE